MRWSHRNLYNTLFPILALSSSANASVVGRYFQNTVYDSLHDQILFIGGTTATANATSDVYSLDLSAAFNRTSANFTSRPAIRSAVSDAAATIDKDGNVYLLGGLQQTCSNSSLVQTFNTNTSVWSLSSFAGIAPGPRRGARAVLNKQEILYFGGKSLTNCSANQYYYNTLYHFDTVTHNWTVSTTTNPPVAQAEMAMTAIGTDGVLLIGGESVSSTATATWVGMTQFARYDSTSNTWSYVSEPQSTTSATSITSRSGHSAAFNGTHTFVFGGAIGSSASTPNFFTMRYANSSLTTSIVSSSDISSAPPTSLYGHSAIMTKNGIMVIAFGLLGSATSSSYNTQIYLYDTVQNKWLDSYDPKANVQAPVRDDKGNGISTGSMVAAILIPLVLLLVAILVVVSIVKKRRARAKRLQSYPVNRLGTFSPDEKDYDHDRRSLQGFDEKSRSVHLPPWAAMHACQARSKSPPPDADLATTTIDQMLENEDGHRDSLNVQDVQFACPPSPRDMTFTAPRLQLRVVNPDHGSARNSLDVARSVPELIETTRSGLITRVPITITNEDDLEVLRTQLAESPMVGDISDQLAGLGLVIREDVVREPATGDLVRVRTITRQASTVAQRNRTIRRAQSTRGDHTAPRLSIIPDLSSSLDLESMLAVGSSVSPVMPSGFSTNSPEFSSYSPYLDSPRSSVASSPRQPGALARTASAISRQGILRSPSPTKRKNSWSSTSSRTELLRPLPSTSQRGRKM